MHSQRKVKKVVETTHRHSVNLKFAGSLVTFLPISEVNFVVNFVSKHGCQGDLIVVAARCLMEEETFSG